MKEKIKNKYHMYYIFEINSPNFLYKNRISLSRFSKVNIQFEEILLRIKNHISNKKCLVFYFSPFWLYIHDRQF